MTTTVRGILDEWVQRLNAGELAAVADLYAEQVMLLATFAPNPATKPESIRAYFDNLGRLDELSVTIDEESVREFGNSIAGLYTFAHRVAGTPVTVPSRFTFVIDPQRERPILHHHSSEVPADR